MRVHPLKCSAVALSLACLLPAVLATAAPPPPPGPIQQDADARPTPLPCVLQDGSGNNWDVQMNGTIGDGTRDSYDGGCHVMVNGMDPQFLGTGMVQKNGREVFLGPAQTYGGTPTQGLTVTRLIYVPDNAAYCRFVDVYDNSGPQPVGLALSVMIDLGSDGGTQCANTSSGDQVIDPADTWAVTDDGMNGQSDPVLAHIWTDGRPPVAAPQVTGGTSNGNIAYAWNGVTIPAGGRVAVAYFEIQASSRQDAENAARSFDTNQALDGVAGEVRSVLLNFSQGRGRRDAIGISRDPSADLLELRSGDRLLGEVLNESFGIETLYGSFDVEAAQMAGFVVSERGASEVRIALETGDVYAGSLRESTVRFRLAGGQEVALAANMLVQLGFRERPNARTELPAGMILLSLKSGDVLHGELLERRLRLRTAYGRIEIDVQHVREMSFGEGENNLHSVTLDCGSELTGVFEAPTLRFRLADGEELAVRREAIERLAMPQPEEASLPTSRAAVRPEVKLRNGDTFIGLVQNESITVAAPYGVLTLDPRQATEIEMLDEGWLQARLRFFNGTVITGRIREAGELVLRNEHGVDLRVLASEVQRISCPVPMVPPEVERHIAELIELLGSDDFSERDEAQTELVRIGRPALRYLATHRDHPDSEIRYRVRRAIEEIEESPPPRR